MLLTYIVGEEPSTPIESRIKPPQIKADANRTAKKAGFSNLVRAHCAGGVGSNPGTCKVICVFRLGIVNLWHRNTNLIPVSYLIKLLLCVWGRYTESNPCLHEWRSGKSYTYRGDTSCLEFPHYSSNLGWKALDFTLEIKTFVLRVIIS